MYESECEDEEWLDFLKEYLQPLPEMTPCEDDEHIDPEYNVMADAEDSKSHKLSDLEKEGVYSLKCGDCEAIYT